jgi:hypothetical protein
MKKWGIGVMVMAIFVSLSFAQELLQNPGFESWTAGMPDYWVNETGSFDVFQESGIVHGGSYSAKLILRSTSTQRFVQYVGGISPGAGYEFSFYAFDNDPYGRVRVVMRWYDASGGFLGGYYGDYSVDSTDWQYLTSGPQTAPAGAESLHVEIRLYDVSWPPGESAVLYVDDASLVMATPPPPETLTIYEIQGQTSSSPYDGEVVVTYGIVTGVFGNNFFMEEQPGGAWHGIYVYRGGAGDPPVAVGDSIEITAEVDEWYGMTELKNVVSLNILASGVTVPGPTLLLTGDVPVEDYEGVFVKVDGAQCTNPSLGYGEWEVDDGSGPVRVDDMGVSYTPDSGNYYMVQGPLYYSYGNFKIEPRDSNDIFDYGPTFVKEGESRDTPTISLLKNPARGDATFLLSLMEPAKVTLSIYNVTGERVRTLNMGILEAGNHRIVFDGNGISSGVYFFKLEAGERNLTGRFILLR